MLRVYIAGGFILGANCAYLQVYTSLGDGKISFFFAFLRKIILLIPLIYLLPLIPFIDSMYAVLLAEPISDVVTCLCNGIYFKKYMKKKIVISEQKEQIECTN